MEEGGKAELVARGLATAGGVTHEDSACSWSRVQVVEASSGLQTRSNTVVPGGCLYAVSAWLAAAGGSDPHWDSPASQSQRLQAWADDLTRFRYALKEAMGGSLNETATAAAVLLVGVDSPAALVAGWQRHVTTGLQWSVAGCALSMIAAIAMSVFSIVAILRRTV
jgi:hypothetical protein